MSRLVEQLDRRPFLVLDGGLATELERHGADLKHHLWSARMLMDDPTSIRDVHLEYFRAGADVATTASYQASLLGFRESGLTDRDARDLVQRSVALAEEARELFLETDEDGSRELFIAGSAGSFGASKADGSEFRGDFAESDEQIRDFHRWRFEVLLEAGVDCLAIETIPCLREAQLVIEVLGEFPAASGWLSMSCQSGTRTCAGERFEDCMKQIAQSSQLFAVGVNCTAPAYLHDLLSHCSEVKKPLIAYPNSGETWSDATRGWLPGGAGVDWTSLVRHGWACGARFIGGCCRTTIEDVQILAGIRNGWTDNSGGLL